MLEAENEKNRFSALTVATMHVNCPREVVLPLQNGDPSFAGDCLISLIIVDDTRIRAVDYFWRLQKRLACTISFPVPPTN
jgi:ssRNA-specific RNase YbeY (16S rRNA maturation enzyme)